ncbi:kinesin-like protein KIF2A isoform X1 [Anopheles merus]|uniref:kinesin-like protein KIF2A isoform X1 n=1 Tax=Anopheles merus TaxID=30066 RepID=UPI001BE3FA2F|nr:kinesin-like protein KIF2A isoform X1 [Anopheles merus]
MEMFEKGSVIYITRSDGRIHTAIVSRFHEDTRSVTVEWYERGESKGKEIEIDMLLELNRTMQLQPQLQQELHHQQHHQHQQHYQQQQQHEPEPKPTAEEAKQRKKTPAPANLARRSSSIEDEEDTSQPEQTNPTQAIIRYNNYLAQRGDSGKGASIPAPSNFNRATILHTGPTQRSEQSGTGRTTNVSSRILGNSNNTGRSTMINNRAAEQPAETRTQPKALGKTSIATGQQQTTAPAAGAAAAAAPASAVANANNAVANSIPRKSSCVVTVGMMEENRIKQRDMFKVMREKKNALMNQDGGNPNWEFINMIREYQSTIDFRPLVQGQSVDQHQITVCVRKRPLNQKEQTRKEVDVVCIPNKDTVIVHEPKAKVDLTKYLDNQKFRFDCTFDDTCSNEMVYMYTAKPLVQAVFEGAMATCFAYGQTGSGKTHTMGGTFNGKSQDSMNGIYALATRDIFELLQSPKYQSNNLVVSASFYEIYCGNVYDLLANKNKARVLEDGKKQVQVVGLTEREVNSVDEVLAIISSGSNLRTSGQTAANSNSSRSHAIFSLTLRVQASPKVHGKFSFIDLAGNERGADTVSENRRTRSESSEINKSLLSLKECIRALGRKRHLPYRGSVLTKVLRDSFVGKNIRTCMIAMIAPGMASCEHTLNTLRYAHRVKELAVVDPDDRVDPEEDLNECDEPTNGGTHNFNDLEQLRSLNEQEMTMELYNQHKAISDLQQKEEEVLDNHQRVNEFLEKFLPEAKELYNFTNLVDYDQDAYCKRGEELFSQLAEVANAFKDLMSEFRTKLSQEEIVSQAAKLSHRK